MSQGHYHGAGSHFQNILTDASAVWAPEVHWINNAWYIYYSASNKDDLGTQRIHLLKGEKLSITDTTAKD